MFEFGAMADRSRLGGMDGNGEGDSSLGRQDPNRRVGGGWGGGPGAREAPQDGQRGRFVRCWGLLGKGVTVE